MHRRHPLNNNNDVDGHRNNLAVSVLTFLFTARHRGDIHHRSLQSIATNTRLTPSQASSRQGGKEWMIELAAGQIEEEPLWGGRLRISGLTVYSMNELRSHRSSEVRKIGISEIRFKGKRWSKSC